MRTGEIQPTGESARAYQAARRRAILLNSLAFAYCATAVLKNVGDHRRRRSRLPRVKAPARLAAWLEFAFDPSDRAAHPLTALP